MAKLLSSEGIQSGLTVKPQHISQYVNAFNGSEAYGITISGSLTLSGSLFLHSNTLAPSSQDYILAYNNNTGKISKTPTTIIKDQAQSLFTHGTSNGIITTVDNASDTITISHGNTSNVVDINNSDGNVIQNIGLDSYGHITSSNSTNLDTRYLRNITINGVTSTSKTSDGSINLFGGEGIALTSGTNGIVITSTITSSGEGGGGGGGSNENFYLNNIQRLNNSNQLTFTVEGAPNQTFEFGSNAYTSTTIPTDTGDLTNSANFATVSQVPTDENIRDLAQNLFTNGTSGGIITNVSDTNNTITITHDNTSDQADVNNSDGTVIQDIFLDAYGHVNQINSHNLDNRYMRNWKLAVNGEEINTVESAEQINLVQGNNVTISSDTNSNTITIEATDTNNYLSNILKSGNSLNFIMNGNSISNPTFLFGSNAFTSTTIPTDTGDLTNGANFATVSQVPTDENVRDLAQGLFSNGTSDGITTTVNDINNTIAITHANTSDQADVNNSGGNIIQDIFLDAYGHVNQINSHNLDNRYMRNWKLAVNGEEINTVESAEQINLVQGNNVIISSDTNSPNTVTIEATDTNFYLNGITQNNNTLTFSVNGTSNPTFTFGSNAFTSTTIPTDTNDLTNGANFITTAGVTNGSGISTSVNSNTNTVSISHANTSDQADVNNSGGNIIQDIFLDDYGHITSLGTANLDTRYMRNWKLAVNGEEINTVESAEQINLVQGNNVIISSDTNSPNTVTIEATNTDTNFYLNGITQNNNTLTFSVNGTSNPTFTFGSNAFTSTTIPTDTGDLTNGANFITTAGVTNGSGISTSVNSNTNTVSISHANTSDQADVNNSNGNVIQDITLDTYGHITSLGSTNLDNRYLRKDADTSTNYIITANDFQLSSDKNLKENIKPLNKSIDVDWVEYNFKDKPEEKRYGVIAQDLEEKHPEFVNNSENGKTVSYIDLLVAKISELENRIKTLENASK